MPSTVIVANGPLPPADSTSGEELATGEYPPELRFSVASNATHELPRFTHCGRTYD
ncbi:hypothetical protein P3T36_002257 [Kitasatospora sp. MAP12-15]|uniref:hypothetical protein n=1 Tax=unclassified Kitasatospora TaxID=2633591 RepID=UPI0024740D7B|nr:hypothetical protein [Kitasatospora sp. MAP12-44]MDH6108823.1 hypothetical protein [Kitasatospora sp. MAP12-44]